MEPFDSYPGKGNQLLGRRTGANCRHEYGLRFQKLTGSTRCAYCGVDLTDEYEHWLLMALDHVVPRLVADKLRIGDEWFEDYLNSVLCCSACNHAKNRWEPRPLPAPPRSLAEFLELRDMCFAQRREAVLQYQKDERAFYDGQPWRKTR